MVGAAAGSGSPRAAPDSVDVSIVVDDTMCKGIESWAWYGIQPINKLVRPGGALVVTSDKEPDALLEHIKVKDYPYTLVVVPGGSVTPSDEGSGTGLCTCAMSAESGLSVGNGWRPTSIW